MWKRQTVYVRVVEVTSTSMLLTLFFTLAIAAAIVQVIAEYILVISLVIWSLVLLFIGLVYLNKNKTETNRVEAVVYPLLQIPTYMLLVQIIMECAEYASGYGSDWFFLAITIVLTAPVMLLISTLLNTGIAYGMVRLYKRVFRSNIATVLISSLVAVFEVLVILILFCMEW